MAKVILICGKICSGKTYYAEKIMREEQAVLLSVDEATYDLILNEQGEFYNVFSERVRRYLRKKAAEIARAGTSVVLDWGFWTAKDRRDISAYFLENHVKYEWHYIAIADDAWRRQIEERNANVQAGSGGSAFRLDEGLLRKLLSAFEEPAREEMNVWHENR